MGAEDLFWSIAIRFEFWKKETYHNGDNYKSPKLELCTFNTPSIAMSQIRSKFVPSPAYKWRALCFFFTMIFSNLLLASVVTAGVIKLPLKPAHGETSMGQLYYQADIQVGSPAQSVKSVIFDTGSGHLWVPGSNSSTCEQGGCASGVTFDISKSKTWQFSGYSQGWDGSGITGNDSVSFAGLNVDMQVWVSLDQIDNELGVFGQGPLSGEDAQASFVESLSAAGKIPRPVFSLNSEAPIGVHEDSQNWDHVISNVYYGGFDSKKYEGPLTTVDLDDIDNEFFQLPISGFKVDGKNVELTTKHSVVLDTGGITLELTNSTVGQISQQHSGGYDANGWFIDCNAKPTLEYIFGTTTVPVDFSIFIQKDNSGVCRFPDITIAPDDQQSLLQGPPLISRALLIFDSGKRQVTIAKARFSTESEVVELTGDIPGAVHV